MHRKPVGSTSMNTHGRFGDHGGTFYVLQIIGEQAMAVSTVIVTWFQGTQSGRSTSGRPCTVERGLRVHFVFDRRVSWTTHRCPS